MRGDLSREVAEETMIRVRVQRKEITGASDPNLNAYKYSTNYVDPVSVVFPLLSAAVNRTAVSCSKLDPCMSSDTTKTFGIKNIEPWIIQASDTMQVGQEVGDQFIKNCRSARLKKAANPFVPTYYQDA